MAAPPSSLLSPKMPSAPTTGEKSGLGGQHLADLRLDGTEQVLDVGCGNGKVAAAIARRLTSGSVLGVAPSTRTVAFARAHWTGVAATRSSCSSWPTLRPRPIAASSIWSSRSTRSTGCAIRALRCAASARPRSRVV